MELRRYLSVARRRALLILAVVAAALIAGWLITPRDKTYTATSTLYVGSQSINTDPSSGEVSGDRVAGFDRLIHTFTAMLSSAKVAQAAASEADVDRTAGAIGASTKAQQQPQTNLISVSVTDPDPAVARTVVNAVSDAFVEQAREFESQDRVDSGRVVSVYQYAGLPGSPNSSGLARNLALAGLFGLVVAGAVIALLEHLDISFRSSEDVERHLELLVLGVIPALGEHLPTAPATRIEGVTANRANVETGAPVG
jgi:capsular polysaccharide biosynthesis protein